MQNSFFQTAEEFSEGDKLPLDSVLENLLFNEQGLVPVIVQDDESRQVLMMAWMNKEAILKTLDTGKMTYWSRSRQSFWVKGETSGHTQQLVSMHIDCDGDSLLCFVKQSGAACHTYRPHCFYMRVEDSRDSVVITCSSPANK